MAKTLISKQNSGSIIPALVMGDDVAALNVIRSLGRNGIDVYVMGNNPNNYGAVSRYARFVFCKNVSVEKQVISKLLEISRQAGKNMVLFSTSDLHVMFVSRNRELLKQYYKFVLPDHEVIEMLMNKKDFHNFAERHGFPLPRTFFSENRHHFEEVAPTIPYPCVAKALYHTRYWINHVPPNKKVIKAESLPHLRQELIDLAALNQPLIFQEWIPGSDEQIYFCLAYVNEQGKPLGLFAGRKLRQYPPLTGVTSLAESIRHQKVIEETLRVLNAAGCKGLCSLEFKHNPTDCSFRITEPTVGRVDLQEGISTQTGLDLIFMAYQDALGISQPFRADYQTGIKWINEPFEFNSFLAHFRKSNRKIGEFFRPYKGRLSFALLAADDPIPFLFFLKWAGKRQLRYFTKIISTYKGASLRNNAKGSGSNPY
jgi:D-aspartate ligase